MEPQPLEPHGQWPAGLDGTLYRNGPAGFEVHGDRLNHLFDGDPLLTAIEVHGGVAHYRSAFVETAKRGHERAVGRRLYPRFGTLPPRGLLDVLCGRTPERPPNVNVIAYKVSTACRWSTCWRATRSRWSR